MKTTNKIWRCILHQETRQNPTKQGKCHWDSSYKIALKENGNKNKPIPKFKTTNSEEEVESTNYTAHKKNNGIKIRRMNSSRRPVSRLPNDWQP